MILGNVHNQRYRYLRKEKPAECSPVWCVRACAFGTLQRIVRKRRNMQSATVASKRMATAHLMHFHLFQNVHAAHNVSLAIGNNVYFVIV